MGYDYNYTRRRRQRELDQRQRREPGFNPVSRVAIINLMIGVVAGIVLGLLYAWALAPVAVVDSTPDTLRADYRAEYVLLVAQAYSVDSNLPQAQARLATLRLPNIAMVVARQTETLISSAAPEGDIRAMVALAAALGTVTDAMQPYLR